MPSAAFKEGFYRELVRITRALSSPRRMEIVDTLSQRPFSVEELAAAVSISMASASQHLQVLKAARLVDVKRNGTYMIYSISDDCVLKLVSAVRELGYRRNAEIERLIRDFRSDKEILESITLEELEHRSAKEKIFLVDVRPEEEYRAGHIPGAVSIPMEKLKKAKSVIPRGRLVVAYCRGPLCVLAVEAVRILSRQKFRAVRMEDGYAEWKVKQSRAS